MRQHCLFLILLLVGGCHGDDGFEDRPYDGWYNNLDHPEWGAAETPMLRQSPTAYSDGVYGPSGAGRPNPLDISKAAHQGRTGLPSFVGRTAMLVFFGQQLVEEIVDSQRPGCPVEYFNIPVPTGHPQFDPRANGDIEMTFKRSRYDFTTGYSPNNPRKQLNEITPFLDGQVIYGPNKAWTDAIRELKGGRLAASSPDNIMMSFPPNNTARLPYSNPPVAREHKLKPVSRFHALGNPRGNENPFLLAFGILWHRWHNFQAGQIALKHPEYTDEQIFNIARKRVTAQYQKIVFYDWLPVWLNTSVSPDQFKRIYPYTRSSETTSKSDGFPYAGSYSGYMADVHPGIKLEFQSAAMRSGCNFLRSTDPNSKRQYAALRLCNSYFDSRGPVEEDMDALFRGMASTIAEREDSILVPDLTESLFGPLEFSRRDLAALNIQRGRDHGLADYNTVRESYGLKKVKTWDEINPMGFNKPEIRKLSELYNRTGSSLDELDLFTGGLLETTAEGPGELFHHVTLDQFLRIRHGDRFWFENTRYSGLTEQELYDVENTRLVDIINVVTQVSSQQVQTDVFRFRQADGGNGCFDQPVQLAPNKTYDGVPLLAPCSGLETFDYFSGSEVSFAVSFFALAACCPCEIQPEVSPWMCLV
ncbi:DUOX-like protein [Mya arenaria]|uniref:DUOX-like protein n=1 Tax=Mya arenaria TaxID=6604 RepID=A0ABY7DRP4_MYAAR|nr:DUOX-like protein [Mya arenaria]